MIKTFSIARIAQSLGLDKVLTFRPLGKKAKEIIISEISELNPGAYVNLDFQNIYLSDVSFVDEVVIEVQLYIRKKDNILLFISNLAKDVYENLEAALALREHKYKQRIQILNKIDDEFGLYSYIGSLERNLHETFDLLKNGRHMTARDVADKFNIEINSASNRLKKLYDAGLLLRREQIDTNGKSHIYYINK